MTVAASVATARLERVAGGFAFIEGPIWRKDEAASCSSATSRQRHPPLGERRRSRGHDRARGERAHLDATGRLIVSEPATSLLSRVGSRRQARDVDSHYEGRA